MKAGEARGFSLAELLVVVAIVILLAGILLPSLGRAIEMTRRTTCRTNLKEIVNACQLYAQAPNEHSGTTPLTLPVGNIDTGKWWDLNSGRSNAESLWLLVTGDFCVPKVFLCPSLRTYQPAALNAVGFGANNCGYSYQSMLKRDAGGSVSLRTYSVADIGAMVILGDLNPWPGDSDRTHNSASHGQIDGNNEGQNIARLGGSVAWATVSKIVTGNNGDDWIYKATANEDDANGAAGGSDDVFLIP